MNYSMKKAKILADTKLLLEQYEMLTRNVSIVMSSSNEITNHFSELTSSERQDWILTCSQNEDLAKLGRLTAALLYVQDPQDKDVRKALLNDIEIHGVKSRIN